MKELSQLNDIIHYELLQLRLLLFLLSLQIKKVVIFEFSHLSIILMSYIIMAHFV